METKLNKTIWIITNHKGEFIKAIETREDALEEMKKWRDGCEKVGLFQEVSKVDAVYCDRITFTIFDRAGEERTCRAKETILY